MLNDLLIYRHRQAATVASNVAMYSITLGIIDFRDNSTIKDTDLPVSTLRINYQQLYN